jgi:hypothetical protein
MRPLRRCQSAVGDAISEGLCLMGAELELPSDNPNRASYLNPGSIS